MSAGESSLPGAGIFAGRQLGRYRIESKLGAGGMAEVFQALDTALDRRVAVKIITPAFAADSQFRERFLREAKVVASLDHPHILPLFDVGEEEGLPFLVMPLVAGGTLAEHLRGRRPLPLEQVALWVAQIGSALDAAHGAGILHRDVKPGNILIGQGGRLLLSDFGIARLGEVTTRLTRTGTVIGTPIYMAPEVAHGEVAGHQADLYSLAVMAFEMLTGRPPFEGESVLSILHQHAVKPPPLVRSLAASLPAAIDEAIGRGLAKEPQGRPSTCTAFAETLLAALPTEVRASLSSGLALALPEQGQTLELQQGAASFLPSHLMTTLHAADTPSAAASPSGPSPASTPMPSTTFFAPPRAKRPSLPVIGLLALVFLLGGLLVWQFLRPPSSRPTVAAPAPPALSPGGGTSASSAVAEVPKAPEPVPAPAPVPERRPALGAQAPSREALDPEMLPADLGALRDLLTNPRLQELRSLGTRPSADAFSSAALALAEEARSGRLSEELIEPLVQFTQAGVAYLTGDDVTASRDLQAALASENVLSAVGPSSPLHLLAPAVREPGAYAPWELAIAFGDPRHNAATEIAARIGGGDPRLQLASAFIHRLDRQPLQVAEKAGPAYKIFLGKGSRDLAAVAAQLVAEAYTSEGRHDDAIFWYRKAIETRSSFTTIIGLQAATRLREMRRFDESVKMLKLSCDNGSEAACRRLERPSRRRGRGGS